MKKHTALFAATAIAFALSAARADDEEDTTAPAATTASTAATPASSEVTEYRRSSVVERSPFAKSERARRGGSSGDSLELRGFFGSGDSLQVSLTRPDTKESAWISVGDKNAKWVVETADADAGTADVNFDGLRLHLTLAKAEVPEVTESRRVGGGPGGGRWGGNMSEEGRQAMREAMRSGFDRARNEHPEWFDGRTLTAEQQQARTDYMRAGWNQAREAVAKVSQVDAQQMSAEPPFLGGGGPGGRESRQTSNENTAATVTVSNGSSTVTPANTNGNNGGNNNNAGGTRRNRGNRGGN